MSQDHATTINAMHEGTWAGGVGVVVESATEDLVTAKVVVRADHRQPQGIVHGGVHASIVETLASTGAAIAAAAHGKFIVGLENHTSFVRAAREGTLSARATPVTRGRRTQLWEVVIADEDDKTVATGRVRFLVVDPEADVAGAKLATPSGGE